MKNLNQILFAAVIATTLSVASQANAGIGTEGIAASPKLRQVLNEQNASSRTAPAIYSAPRNDGIAASPKVRQMLNEQKRNSNAGKSSSAVASAAYQSIGADGILASPKLREQLNERTVAIMVAPVK